MKLHIKIEGEYPCYEGTKITNVETGEPVRMFGFDLTVRAGEGATLNGQIVDVETDITVDVGTLSSFSDEELLEEMSRRDIVRGITVTTSPADLSSEAKEVIQGVIQKIIRSKIKEAAQCTCPSLAAGHLPDCPWKAAR